MDLHLPNTENWFSLNKKIQDELKLPPDVNVRTYRGLHHAVFEVAQGTATFLAHKRSVAWRKGQSYAFGTALPYLYKEAFIIQPLSQKDPNMEIAAWVESLKKDTSFALMSEDHPVTGELFDNDQMDSLLNDKKIFSFRVSHQRHWLRGLPNVRPYSVAILEVSEDLAIAVLGSKFKSPVQVSAHFQFNEEAVLTAIRGRVTKESEDQRAIEKFLAQVPPAFQVLARGGSALQDRCLIYHPDINGQALSAELGLGDHCLPLTACAQGFVDWEWWEGRPGFNQIRGLILLDLQAVRSLTGTQRLADAVSRCQI